MKNLNEQNSESKQGWSQADTQAKQEYKHFASDHTRHGLVLWQYQQDMVLLEETKIALKFRHLHSIVKHWFPVPAFIACLTSPATTYLVIMHTLQFKFSLVCH